MAYEIGQIFTGEYPPEAADFCNESGNFYITEIEADADGNRQFQIVAVPEPTVEELQAAKLTALKTSFNSAVSGSFTTTQGYLMQFNEADSAKLFGTIQLMKNTGQTTGYITQADDTTVYDVPIETMEAVFYEMLAQFASMHTKKQLYRAQIANAETEADLTAITFEW